MRDNGGDSQNSASSKKHPLQALEAMKSEADLKQKTELETKLRDCLPSTVSVVRGVRGLGHTAYSVIDLKIESHCFTQALHVLVHGSPSHRQNVSDVV